MVFTEMTHVQFYFSEIGAACQIDGLGCLLEVGYGM
jgi:hypothetical protein